MSFGSVVTFPCRDYFHPSKSNEDIFTNPNHYISSVSCDNFPRHLRNNSDPLMDISSFPFSHDNSALLPPNDQDVFFLDFGTSTSPSQSLFSNSSGSHNETLSGSAAILSPVADISTLVMTHGSSCGIPPKFRVAKRRNSANKKERRRTLSINSAFSDLRDCIPNVPLDTKLSKIKTLRLATSYISYLMGVLDSDDSQALLEGGFQTILQKALDTREDRRKREMVKTAAVLEKKQYTTRNRTGWPQHVWELELNHQRKQQTRPSSKF